MAVMVASAGPNRVARGRRVKSCCSGFISEPPQLKTEGGLDSQAALGPSGPVSRVLYPHRASGGGDHLSGAAVTRRLKRPTRGLRAPHEDDPARAHGARRLHSPPIWPCSGWGLPSRPVTRPLVRSYRTVSPLPALAGGEPLAVWSLWHFPSGRPAWALPSTLPGGARTFLGRPKADRSEE